MRIALALALCLLGLASDSPRPSDWMLSVTATLEVDGTARYYALCVPRHPVLIRNGKDIRWRQVEVDHATYTALRHGDDCPPGDLVGVFSIH